MRDNLTYYEFFAGGGMARAALGTTWSCMLANDFDPVKAAVYKANWGSSHFYGGDVARLPPDLLAQVDMVWASSPCQDFSSAGKRLGLAGAKSSAFWSFWKHVVYLREKGLAPRCVIIENVSDLLVSHGGDDFTAICTAMAEAGYWFGAVEVDAARFTAQSRVRLFLIALRDPPGCSSTILDPLRPQHTRRIEVAYSRLPDKVKENWIWWSLGLPPTPRSRLDDFLQEDARVEWHNEKNVKNWLSLLSPLHKRKLLDVQRRGTRFVGTAVRRMRLENGCRVQRAELRFDGIAQCIRVPRGGSSSQQLIFVEGSDVRMRSLTPEEGKRLMGLPDSYKLPTQKTAAFTVIGDGVVVPVIKHIIESIVEPELNRRDLHGQEERELEIA